MESKHSKRGSSGENTIFQTPRQKEQSKQTSVAISQDTHQHEEDAKYPIPLKMGHVIPQRRSTGELEGPLSDGEDRTQSIPMSEREKAMAAKNAQILQENV